MDLLILPLQRPNVERLDLLVSACDLASPGSDCRNEGEPRCNGPVEMGASGCCIFLESVNSRPATYPSTRNHFSVSTLAPDA